MVSRKSSHAYKSKRKNVVVVVWIRASATAISCDRATLHIELSLTHPSSFYLVQCVVCDIATRKKKDRHLFFFIIYFIHLEAMKCHYNLFYYTTKV